MPLVWGKLRGFNPSLVVIKVIMSPAPTTFVRAQGLPLQVYQVPSKPRSVPFKVGDADLGHRGLFGLLAHYAIEPEVISLKCHEYTHTLRIAAREWPG